MALMGVDPEAIAIGVEEVDLAERAHVGGEGRR